MVNHKYKGLAFFLFLCIICFDTMAQFEGVPFYSDRPGQSLTPYFVGRNGLQFQNGIGYKRSYLPDGRSNNIMFNQNVIR